jgi:Fe-S oxidoreductase
MSKCNECGLCREACPVFSVLRRESVSPRGFAVLIKKEAKDKMFYLCSLCNNCERVCPYGARLKLLRNRERLVDEGVETKGGKEVIENLKRYGNPYGL